MSTSRNPQTGHLDCAEVALDLPWLANGSLDGARGEAVREHVEGCARCRLELEETREAAREFGQHVPSFDLARYACGESLQEGRTVLLERHLEVCSLCREDLELILSSRLEKFPAAGTDRQGARPLPLRQMVGRGALLAAAIAALVALASLVVPLRHGGAFEATPEVTANEVVTPAEVATGADEASPEVDRGPGDAADDTGGVFGHDFEDGLAKWTVVVGARDTAKVAGPPIHGNMS